MHLSGYTGESRVQKGSKWKIRMLSDVTATPKAQQKHRKIWATMQFSTNNLVQISCSDQGLLQS